MLGYATRFRGSTVHNNVKGPVYVPPTIFGANTNDRGGLRAPLSITYSHSQKDKSSIFPAGHHDLFSPTLRIWPLSVRKKLIS